MKHSGKVFLAVFSLSLAAWLVLVFLEGDACADAGGSFSSITMQCHVAQSRTYVPLVARDHWPFWAFYSAVTVFAAALIFGLGSGTSVGLRSAWVGLTRGRSKA